MSLFLRKGEKVTCENGHLICEAVADISGNSLMRVDDFTNWQQEKPQPWDGPPTLCAQCGARYADLIETGLAGTIHTENGWAGKCPPIKR